MFEDIPSHRQLRKLVADQIRTAIFDGRFKPGEWLRQERVAQELGVSQMPVREALKELASEGLIEHVPYRGARVIALSREDIEDLYEHRAFLEARAAQLAVKHITETEIAELKSMLAEMESLPPEQIAQYRKVNRNFHEKIFHISQREYIIRTLTQMWEAFPTMLIGNFALTAEQPLPERDLQDQEEHREIMAALESRDGERAGVAMKTHILSAVRNLIDSLKVNQ